MGRKRLIKLGISLLTFLVVFLSQVSPSFAVSGGDRVIVKFRLLAPQFLRDRLIKSRNLFSQERLRMANTFVFRVPKGMAREVTGRLQKSLLVDYAEEDFVAEAFETPNDPLFANQWGLTKIKAPGAWNTTHGGSLIDIAIVDTGINSNHSDLISKITTSVDCTISPSCPSRVTSDPDGHGTHVAGIASAITGNSLGIAGTSWEGRLMSVKVLDDTGSGYYSWVANGIYWAADNGAEVINLSLGGSSGSTTLKNAVDYAWGKGVVLVVAAGNSRSRAPSYPAYYPNAIAVAATDQNDKKASFSNYGSWVDVAAPGVSILSTYQSDYGVLSGTSMSAPFVSGLASLIFGQNPGWSNSQVRNQIEKTADKISGTGSLWVWGRINACQAVGCEVAVMATPTPTPVPTPTATSLPSTTPTPTSTPTSTPIVSPTPTPTSSPTPSPTSLPWWCQYIPDHYTCRL